MSSSTTPASIQQLDPSLFENLSEDEIAARHAEAMKDLHEWGIEESEVMDLWCPRPTLVWIEENFQGMDFTKRLHVLESLVYKCDNHVRPKLSC